MEPPKKKSELAYRLLVLVLLIGIVCLHLFMRQNFVSAAEYRSDKKTQDELMSKMHDEILQLIAADKANSRQDEALRDHEARLRLLEQRRP